MVPKILLVDDVTMFLELQKSFLKLSSVHVLTARDGAEALEVSRKERPALIFMDLHMPRMDGAECCLRLKKDPVLGHVPVVMLTAAGKEEDRELCLRAGCDDFLTKPIDRAAFLAKARKFLPTIDRRNRRVPCRAKVKFRLFGITLSGETCDLSDNGMYLATDYDVEVGATLEMLFALPETGTVIQARGRVAWINNHRNRCRPSLPEGVGVEFVSIGEEMGKVLAGFVAGAK